MITHYRHGRDKPGHDGVYVDTLVLASAASHNSLVLQNDLSRGFMKLHFVLGSMLAFATLVVTTAAQAADGFEAVHCGADVRTALLGKKLGSGPTDQMEKRHADLGLKDLGGDELNDDLGSVFWKICGKDYFTVVASGGAIRDVLELPQHTHTAPHFTSLGCKINGKPDSDLVVGVYDNTKVFKPETPNDLLPATAAWTINQKTGKMTPLSVAGLMCPRIDIISSDSDP